MGCDNFSVTLVHWFGFRSICTIALNLINELIMQNAARKKQRKYA